MISDFYFPLWELGLHLPWIGNTIIPHPSSYRDRLKREIPWKLTFNLRPNPPYIHSFIPFKKMIFTYFFKIVPKQPNDRWVLYPARKEDPHLIKQGNRRIKQMSFKKCSAELCINWGMCLLPQISKWFVLFPTKCCQRKSLQLLCNVPPGRKVNFPMRLGSSFLTFLACPVPATGRQPGSVSWMLKNWDFPEISHRLRTSTGITCITEKLSADLGYPWRL